MEGRNPAVQPHTVVGALDRVLVLERRHQSREILRSRFQLARDARGRARQVGKVEDLRHGVAVFDGLYGREGVEGVGLCDLRSAWGQRRRRQHCRTFF